MDYLLSTVQHGLPLPAEVLAVGRPTAGVLGAVAAARGAGSGGGGGQIPQQSGRLLQGLHTSGRPDGPHDGGQQR